MAIIELVANDDVFNCNSYGINDIVLLDKTIIIQSIKPSWVFSIFQHCFSMFALATLKVSHN